MIRTYTRRTAVAAFGAAAVALVLGGCGAETEEGSASSSADKAGSAEPVSVSIGTMATEDFLPGWVAQDEGLFEEAGAEVKLYVFQSAQELTTAITAGEIDMAMTDPMVAASLTAGGTEVYLEWITLGATAEEGRFGIATAADSGITDVAQLAGCSIGVGSDTLPEYVMDRLLEEAGLSPDDVDKEEIKNISVRYQMMESGQTDAAALPASMLALGEANGCITLADDTEGENLSQSVMIVRADFAESQDGPAAIAAVRSAWNEAAELINADPEAYRELLVEEAGLSDILADSYPIPTYPVDAEPTADMIQPMLDWMSEKGYLDEPLIFDEASGSYVAG